MELYKKTKEEIEEEMMGEKFKKLKDENKILIMLAFYSISIGLWNNFQQLWLQDNHLDVSSISMIISIASFVCAIFLILFSNKLKTNSLRNIIVGSLFAKMLNLCLLFFLNHTGQYTLINIAMIIDTILEKIIVISIYPYIVTIKKNNQLYSKRKLVEYLFSDLGILVGSILIGRTISGFIVDYNTCLFLSILALGFALMVILKIQKQKKVEEREIKQKDALLYFMKSKLLRLYLVCYFVGNIAMAIGLGLKMLMLTNLLDFTPSHATQYLLCVGLLADVIGIFILKNLTFKNDYLNISIKFGIRAFLYFCGFFSNDLTVCFLAISWSILISTAYENRTDAPYINRVPNEYQLLYSNYRYIIGLIGTSIGLYLAGILYPLGIPAMLGVSAWFILIQMGICFQLIYKREKEKEEEKKGIKAEKEKVRL